MNTNIHPIRGILGLLALTSGWAQAAVLSSTLPADPTLATNYGGYGFGLDRPERLMAFPISLVGASSDFRFEQISIVMQDPYGQAGHKNYSLEIWSDLSFYEPEALLSVFGSTTYGSGVSLNQYGELALVTWSGTFAARAGEYYWIVMRGSDEVPTNYYINFMGLAYRPWDSVQAISGPLNASHPAWGYGATSLDGGATWGRSAGWDGAGPLRMSYAYEISGSAIPEPSTAAALLGLTAMGCALIRRRRA